LFKKTFTMSYKKSLAVVSLLTDFFFTGWICNWAPISAMLTADGYFDDDCGPTETTCGSQQVRIATLWSAVVLAEFTYLPNGVILDRAGPAFFSFLLFLIHIGSLSAAALLNKNSHLLMIAYFGIGVTGNGCFLLAMRTVFIFETRKGRQRWTLAVCTIYDTSSIYIMFFYNIWQEHLIDLKSIFMMMSLFGGILFATQCLLWILYNQSEEKLGEVVPFVEIDNSLSEKQMDHKQKLAIKVFPTLGELICGYKFYFFVVVCAVNVYRIQYFLGFEQYTLVYLKDKGTYLQLFGYCYILTLPLSPLADKILTYLDSFYLSFHLLNGLITVYFIMMLIHSLPVQALAFVVFILARLFCFTVISDFCAEQFSQKWFGFVMGVGMVAAAIPGFFSYEIVRVAVKKFHGNFWVFHIMCIAVGIPLTLATYVAQQKSDKEFDSDKEQGSSPSSRVISNSEGKISTNSNSITISYHTIIV